MQILLHIGMPFSSAEQIVALLADKRGALQKKGVLYPRAPGRMNHTRLFMAMCDDDHIDPLRWNRGRADVGAPKKLRAALQDNLAREIAGARPEKLILCAQQLGGGLYRPSEIARLHSFLSEFSNDIRVVAHLQEQARALVACYSRQIMQGRLADLGLELELTKSESWWDESLADAHQIDPSMNAMSEVQSAPFWLDYKRLHQEWTGVFGDRLDFRPALGDPQNAAALSAEVAEAFELENIGQITPEMEPAPPSAQWLMRARQMNELFQLALMQERVIPRQLWGRMLGYLACPGDPIDPGSLSAVSQYFAADNAALINRYPALDDALSAPKKRAKWHEPKPEFGFRPSQYFTAFLPRIEEATAAAKKTNQAAKQPKTEVNPLLPPLAREKLAELQTSRFAPRNDIGQVKEEEIGPVYSPISPRALPKGNSGNVIVGCMKNEGPYIVEWVAYHRAIGFDNFLIYTNDCTDGTDEILDRLQELGVLQHRLNENWRGKSPQQFALNQSLKEDVIRNAEWIAHIDVDEFVNIRFGNGTLPELLEKIGDATNLAMTWRLFGNGGIDAIGEASVVSQFDFCAPKYCPKPHTVWGFKTLFRNIGAYDKISCHRPNKLREDRRDEVSWVNGSGQAMGSHVKDKGWRSEVKSIGYDLVQLNHYALRSAESFLIKRQRGRALHVDRSIGANYWIRMDWSDHKDVTIKRNLPRLSAEMDMLFQDKKLRSLHDKALEWHHEKAAELKQNPEFAELYEQSRAIKLTPRERVAYALALDLES